MMDKATVGKPSRLLKQQRKEADPEIALEQHRLCQVGRNDSAFKHEPYHRYGGLAEARLFSQYRSSASRRFVRMELSSVFSKTAKGLDEISTRAHRLPARVRAMLIMIDGHRTGEQLLALCTSSVEGKRHLAQLLNGGFVQQLCASTGTPLPAAMPDEDISLARSYVIRTLYELLGSDAFAVAAEIEKSETLDELRRHFSQLHLALSAVPDRKKVAQFLEKVALVLD